MELRMRKEASEYVSCFILNIQAVSIESNVLSLMQFCPSYSTDLSFLELENGQCTEMSDYQYQCNLTYHNSYIVLPTELMLPKFLWVPYAIIDTKCKYLSMSKS